MTPETPTFTNALCTALSEASMILTDSCRLLLITVCAIHHPKDGRLQQYYLFLRRNWWFPNQGNHARQAGHQNSHMFKNSSVNYELKHSTAQFVSQQSSGNSFTLSIAQRLTLCNLQWFCILIQFQFSIIEYSWLQGEGQYRAKKRPAQRELHMSLSFSKGKDGYKPPERCYTHHF